MAWETDLTSSPFLVLAVSFVAMALAGAVGALFARNRPMDAELREGFEIIRAATLTLLGLIIGFTFSMALTRYDQRKNFEEGEANAIGTEFLRAGLLPEGDAARVRGLLRTYIEERIRFYSVRDPGQLREIAAQTTRLQNELWSAVRTPATAAPSPVTALAVTGMNDVLSSQGLTQGAWSNRIPIGAWRLMVSIALFANLLVGVGIKFARAGHLLLLVLPLVIATAFFLIADIDTPRSGDIHVKPQNLQALLTSLRAP